MKIFYNVTIKVENDIHDDWLKWMKEVHVPDVMNTQLFLESKMSRLLGVDDSDGKTYSFQYLAPDIETLQKYQEEFAPALKNDVVERYKDKFVAYRSIMEVHAEYRND